MARMLRWWVAGVALALLGCAQPQPALPAGEAADTPKFGGVLNTVGGDVTDFDMSYGGKSSDNTTAHGLVYNKLLAFKRGPQVEYFSQILQPELAERWEVSSDARVFSYYLRQGVKFADVPPVSGRELTAADVKWSLEYYSRTGEFKDKKLPSSQVREVYEGLEGVETPDRYTVRVRFKEPFAPFINYSASQWMPIAAREVYEADGDLRKTLVGTGPYIMDLENSQKDNRAVFSKNPTYWGAPKPYLDGIRRLIIPDRGTRQVAFKAKQIDILPAPDYSSVPQIEKNNPEAVMGEYPLGHGGLFLSQRPGRATALTDIRVRRAISLAMDRDEMNKLDSGGKGAWALAGSWPGLFTDAEAHELLRTDLAEAKRLLAEAGYANGLTLEMIVLPEEAAQIRQQLAQAQLKRVGITVNFTVLVRAQHRPRLYPGDFDLWMLNAPGGLGDGDFDAIHMSYYSGSGQNWSQVKDPELDKLVLAQRQEGDPQKRREVHRAVVRRIHEMAWRPGYIFRVSATFWQPYVKNYRPHFTAGQDDAFVWLDK